MNIDYMVEIKEGIFYVPMYCVRFGRIKKLIRAYATKMGLSSVFYRFRPLSSHDWCYCTASF